MSVTEVVGFCRECGHARLILNRRGQIVCTHPFCPDPWRTFRLISGSIERKILPHAEDMVQRKR